MCAPPLMVGEWRFKSLFTKDMTGTEGKVEAGVQ
jgi:hypothetical protein